MNRCLSALRDLAAESVQWVAGCLRDPTIYRGSVVMAAACLATAMLTLQFAGDVLHGRELEVARMRIEVEEKIGASISAETNCRTTTSPTECLIAQHHTESIASAVGVAVRVFNFTLRAGALLLTIGCAGALLAVKSVQPSKKE